MPNWITPITDRTATDIADRTAKAFFNVADWLRVYGNAELVNALTNLLLLLQVPFTELTAPTITTFPNVKEINDLIANIDRCRAAARLPGAIGAVALKHDYAEGINSAAPNYTDVNDWERDLLLIRNALARAADHVVRCGVSNCGQQRFYQNRWRRWAWVSASDTPVRRPRNSTAVCGANLTRQNKFRRYE